MTCALDSDSAVERALLTRTFTTAIGPACWPRELPCALPSDRSLIETVTPLPGRADADSEIGAALCTVRDGTILLMPWPVLAPAPDDAARPAGATRESGADGRADADRVADDRAVGNGADSDDDAGATGGVEMVGCDVADGTDVADVAT